MAELRRIGRVDTLARNCCRRAETERSTFSGRPSALALALILVSGGTGGAIAPAGFLRQLRFSPDGRYALGQDESCITVLTVQPFEVAFRIPAENAVAAHFTPDSRYVVFLSSTTRVDSRRIRVSEKPGKVERWSIAEQNRVDLATIPDLACGTQALSPDGRVFACLDFDGSLHLVDVGSSAPILEVKRLAQFQHFDSEEPISFEHSDRDLGEAKLDFSPDSRFLVLVPWGGSGPTIAWDFRDNRKVKLKQELKLLNFAAENNVVFAFLTGERLIMTRGWLYYGRNGVTTGKLVRFPSGELVATPKLPPGQMYRAADPRFVLIRPFGRYAQLDPSTERAAAVELATGEVIVSDTPALDVFGKHYVAQPAKGMVALYELGKGIQATVELETR